MKRTLVSLLLLLAVVALATAGALYRRSKVPVVNPPYIPPTLLTSEQRESSGYALNYKPAGNVGGEGLFASTLAGVAVYDGGGQDILYAAGDSEVKAFDHCATPRRLVPSFRVSLPPLSIAVNAAGDVLVGQAGQVEKYDPAGHLLATIGKGELGRVTAVGQRGQELLAADADGGLIRRFDADGRHLGDLAPPPVATTQPDDAAGVARFRIRPGGRLAMALLPDGRVAAADPINHCVVLFDTAGRAADVWGRFDEQDPAGFVACCNPQDLGVLFGPGGPALIAAEKGIARVKVYSVGGQLLGLIDAAAFDPANAHMAVASDAGGRIYVCDTQRRTILLFAQAQ
ncbi:MAG: hypothetical protein BIFFINMI_00082 [Phycisphaerae bacterium]|nr:hypothetical protein [Phycisphaerae bacterium]